jgi:cation:H+ antiporter
MWGIIVLLLVGGLVTLVAGAELLVRGGSRLAAALGISPLVIGLTIVAFGTSAPEMAVSVQSALSGQVDIAVGNVVGSNIFNVLFILGLSALIVPLVVAQQLVRVDVPIMIGTSVVVWPPGAGRADWALGRGAALCGDPGLHDLFDCAEPA